MADFSYIKDLGLKPARPYTKRTRTDRVLVHHFGSDASVPSVHAYHLSRGHAGIDYNIVVQKDGSIVWGRGLEYSGGSVNGSNKSTAGMNQTSVAIAIQGNTESAPMPAVQYAALCRVVRDVVQHYGLTSNACVLGHNEAAGKNYTDCPGKHVDMSALRDYALGVAEFHELRPIVQPASPATPSCKPEDFKTSPLKVKSPYMRDDRVKWVQIRLDRHHVDVGGIDGIYGKNTEAGVKLFQAARLKEGRDIGSKVPDGIVGYKTALILSE